MLKLEWVENIRVEEVIMEGIDVLERIRKSEAKDDKVIKAVEEMKKVGVKMLRDKEWREENRLMLKEEKVYMPKDEALRVKIIRLHHNTPMGGHGGQWKMAEMVTRNFWWPGVTREVKQYVEGVVQLILVTGIKPTAPLSAIDKENSLESLLHWSVYLYTIHLVCALIIPHSQPNYV